MAETRTVFPPHELTEDEARARKGRFVMDPKREPAPAGADKLNKYGRTPPAPHGVVYVREGEAEPEDEVEAEAEAEAEAEPEGEVEAEEETAEPEEGEEGADLEGWTVAELKDALDQAEVEYDPRARKAELIELLEQAEAE